MMMAPTLALLLMAGPSAEALASLSSQALFDHALEAEDSRQDNDARSYYEALRSRGVANAAVEYNLGNVYWRLGEVGRSIAAYRRSLALSPGDADVEANLAFARGNTTDALSPPEASIVWQTLLFWHFGLSVTGLLVGSAVLAWIGFGLGFLGFTRERWHKARWGGLAAGVGAATLGCSALWWLWLEPEHAVVTAKEVVARAANQDEAVARFTLHEGAEVLSIEEQGDWQRIRLSDGREAWVAATALEQAR